MRGSPDQSEQTDKGDHNKTFAGAFKTALLVEFTEASVHGGIFPRSKQRLWRFRVRSTPLCGVAICWCCTLAHTWKHIAYHHMRARDATQHSTICDNTLSQLRKKLNFATILCRDGEVITKFWEHCDCMPRAYFELCAASIAYKKHLNQLQIYCIAYQLGKVRCYFANTDLFHRFSPASNCAADHF